MHDREIFFTISDARSLRDLRLNINELPVSVDMQIGNGRVFNIDKQQLGELGGLFLALAGKFDFDSVGELLDGYGFSEAELESLQNNLKKLSDELV